MKKNNGKCKTIAKILRQLLKFFFENFQFNTKLKFYVMLRINQTQHFEYKQIIFLILLYVTQIICIFTSTKHTNNKTEFVMSLSLNSFEYFDVTYTAHSI